jgi:hypothetical protein
MNGLPRLILMAPRIFYGLALFYAAFEILLPLIELSRVGYSTELGGSEGAIRKLLMARLVARALYDALFLVGMGVSAQLLIAIWRNTRRQEPEQ